VGLKTDSDREPWNKARVRSAKL